jgi:hypothetical protein
MRTHCRRRRLSNESQPIRKVSQPQWQSGSWRCNSSDGTDQGFLSWDFRLLRFQCGVLLDVLQYFQSGTIDTYPIREMVDRRCGRFGYLDVLRVPKDKIGKMTEGSWSLHSYEFGDVEIACPAPNVAIIAYTGRQNVTMDGKSAQPHESCTP